METGSIFNRHTIPWSNFCAWLVCELFHLGPTIKWSHSLYNYVIRWCNVVRYFIPASIRWILLWVSQATIRTTSPYKSDSTSSSNSNMVHASCSVYSSCWSVTIRSLLHRAVLYLFGYLWKSVLLPFWIPLPSIHHFGSFLQSNKVTYIINICNVKGDFFIYPD